MNPLAKSPIILALLFVSSFGFGEELPPGVFKRPSVISHQVPLPLSEQLAQIPSIIKGYRFPMPPMEFTVYPYYVAGSDSESDSESDTDPETDPEFEPDEEDGLAILSALFSATFRGLPAHRMLLYRNIFYGYDNEKVNFDLKPSVMRHNHNELFETFFYTETAFRIELTRDLKKSLVLERAARLLALMKIEVQGEMYRRLGGAEVAIDNYQKVNWIAEVYSGVATFQIFARLPERLLEDEMRKFVEPGGPTLLYNQLDTLYQMIDYDLPADFLSHWIFPLPAENEIHSDKITDFLNLMINQHLKPEKMAPYYDEDYDSMAREMFPPVKEWWRNLKKEDRFRLSLNAFTNKDPIVEAIVRSQAIMTIGCDDLLLDKAH